MSYEPAWGLYFNTQAGRRIFRSTWNGLYGSFSGGSRGGALMSRPPPPTLFLDHAEARRAEKDFFDTAPTAPLSQGLDDRPSPPPLPPSEGLDPPLSFQLTSRSVGLSLHGGQLFLPLQVCIYKIYWRMMTVEEKMKTSSWKHDESSLYPGGLSWKKVRGWPSGYYFKGNQSRCGANFINVYLLSLKVKEE